MHYAFNQMTDARKAKLNLIPTEREKKQNSNDRSDEILNAI